eukprot:171908-Rhodomonas_salina.1
MMRPAGSGWMGSLTGHALAGHDDVRLEVHGVWDGVQLLRRPPARVVGGHVPAREAGDVEALCLPAVPQLAQARDVGWCQARTCLGTRSWAGE